jgi:glycosyltransferase involved in cell wall biosynthesis
VKVLHVISGLTAGGAERMLYKLVLELRRRGVESVVVCLGPQGPVSELLREAGVPVHALGLRKDLRSLFRIGGLVSRIRAESPDVLQGWMHQGNLAASAAALLARSPARVFWSVHGSLYSLRHETFVNAGLIRLAARLSARPQAVVYVSRTAREQHARRGFSTANARVVPIGFDLGALPAATEISRADARARLGLDPGARLVGWMGRHDPKKDPLNFIDAAALAAREVPGVRFAMIGRGIDALPHLRARARLRGVEASFRFLGEQRDGAGCMAAFDLFVSSSYSEAFPNVIGEAMAAEVPCVVTDVGDSAYLLGEAGAVVPARDPAALGDAMARILKQGAEARAKMGAKGRERIRELFSLERVGGMYLDLYEADGPPGTFSAQGRS